MTVTEIYACGYEDGKAAGIESARRKLSHELYEDIRRYLDSAGVDRAEEKADYVCQIIKGMTAEEVLK